MPITEANESRRRSSVRRPSIAADKLQGLVSLSPKLPVDS